MREQRVFISYRTALSPDRYVAASLRKFLRSCRCRHTRADRPPKYKHSDDQDGYIFPWIFRDEDEGMVGKDIALFLKLAAESRWIMVVLTSNILKSDHCRSEIVSFVRARACDLSIAGTEAPAASDAKQPPTLLVLAGPRPVQWLITLLIWTGIPWIGDFLRGVLRGEAQRLRDDLIKQLPHDVSELLKNVLFEPCVDRDSLLKLAQSLTRDERDKVWCLDRIHAATRRRRRALFAVVFLFTLLFAARYTDAELADAQTASTRGEYEIARQHLSGYSLRSRSLVDRDFGARSEALSRLIEPEVVSMIAAARSPVRSAQPCSYSASDIQACLLDFGGKGLEVRINDFDGRVYDVDAKPQQQDVLVAACGNEGHALLARGTTVDGKFQEKKAVHVPLGPERAEDGCRAFALNASAPLGPIGVFLFPVTDDGEDTLLRLGYLEAKPPESYRNVPGARLPVALEAITRVEILDNELFPRIVVGTSSTAFVIDATVASDDPALRVVGKMSSEANFVGAVGRTVVGPARGNSNITSARATAPGTWHYAVNWGTLYTARPRDGKFTDLPGAEVTRMEVSGGQLVFARKDDGMYYLPESFAESRAVLTSSTGAPFRPKFINDLLVVPSAPMMLAVGKYDAALHLLVRHGQEWRHEDSLPLHTKEGRVADVCRTRDGELRVAVTADDWSVHRAVISMRPALTPKNPTTKCGPTWEHSSFVVGFDPSCEQLAVGGTAGLAVIDWSGDQECRATVEGLRISDLAWFDSGIVATTMDGRMVSCRGLDCTVGDAASAISKSVRDGDIRRLAWAQSRELGWVLTPTARRELRFALLSNPLRDFARLSWPADATTVWIESFPDGFEIAAGSSETRGLLVFRVAK